MFTPARWVAFIPAFALLFATSTLAHDAVDDEIKLAKANFDERKKKLDEKMVKIFDKKMHEVMTQKFKAEERLNFVEIIQQEKAAFEKYGFIPWSLAAREEMVGFVELMRKNRLELAKPFDRAIDTHTKNKDLATAKKYMERKAEMLKPTLIGSVDVKVAGGAPGRRNLYSDGSLGAGKATWRVTKTALIFTIPDTNAPGGAWIDTLNIARDGKTMQGSNQGVNGVKAILSGVVIPPSENQ